MQQRRAGEQAEHRDLFLASCQNFLISGSAEATIMSTQSKSDVLEVYCKQILGNHTMISSN